jgi:hypothetical protein
MLNIERQNMELEADKNRFDSVAEAIAKRRNARDHAFQGKVKKQKKGPSTGEALKNAEKYKHMVKHTN